MSKYETEDVMINIFSRLSEDLMIKILERLSMKTLLRCGSVCKSWKALIASPYFINAHLNFNKNNTPQILIRSCKESHKRTPFVPKENLEGYYIPNADDVVDEDDDNRVSDSERYQETYLSYYGTTETFDLHNKFDLPCVANEGTFGILGSCNGLICLMYGGNPALIWNPLINKAVFIPYPIYVDDDEFSLAFGFDITRNDYKLVRITSSKSEIYRLSTRIWEDISKLAPTFYLFDDAAYLNGSAHWLGSNQDLHFTNRRIVLFDMCREVFREMSFPSSLEKIVSYPISKLVTHQGSLLLIHCNMINRSDIWKFDIWLMKEYGVAESWIKQYSVDMNYDFYPLGFLDNGELLWEGFNADTSLVSYNPQNKQLRVIVNRTSQLYPFYVAHYVPSLVLHDQKVDFWDKDACILGLNVQDIKPNL